MKKLIIALAALVVSVSAYGQGQFVFNNRIGTEVNARFILLGVDPADGTASSIGSPDYSIQLLGGPAGTAVGSLVPLEPATVQFRGPAGANTAGFTQTGISPIVPNVAPGANADIIVRLVGPGGLSQDFGPYTVSLGGGTIIPPNLQLGTSPLGVVPEPTTLALGALGIGALLLIRRRK